MSHEKLSLRINPENPNHHLWDNHGTWWIHYTVHPTPWTQRRVRRSLGTSDLDVARRQRDAELQQVPLREVAL
jgi:hypothetical protein